jgi:maltooligosyltrehalose trehalohydrolase
MTRKYSHGAELADGGGVSFRVWAPNARRVELVVDSERAPVAMHAVGGGFVEAHVASARAGARYGYLLDGDGPFPDPATRSQPDGVHARSQVIDPSAFAWTDRAWRGVSIEGQIFYELHIGTFTREGTWSAATERLHDLADLGVTTLEMMPVADFDGAFGWGYDGVDHWAPARAYGSPDDLRRFVDRAHALGLGVILDVVYNHFGPSGNYAPKFGPYLAKRATEWGEAIDFDGESSHGVRSFFAENAAYWIDEFHFDGLRLDATQCISDASDEHMLAAVAKRARAAAGARSIVLVAENEPQDSALVRAMGIDAIWNDDFHHSISVAMTGRAEAYVRDFAGTPQELISCAKRGFLFQGQRCEWWGARRGSPSLDLEPRCFVHYLENHDQVANTPSGARMHATTSPGRHRASVALMLLLPQSPMLFQGEELASSAPFVFFADHDPELAKLVRAGRTRLLARLESVASDERARARIPPPDARATFERCKLDHGERARNAAMLALYKDLVALRRGDPIFRAPRMGGVDGAVLGAHAFVLRFFGGERGERLVLCNYGRDLALPFAPEPLLAPPRASRWTTIFSTEDPTYGGRGVAPIEDDAGRWRVSGESLVVLAC